MTATATSRTYGPITNTIEGLGRTRALVGGEGVCHWKMLLYGMHLGHPWHTVEFVVIPPGASCGEHTHSDTEEIYYLLSGRATMYLDGTRWRSPQAISSPRPSAAGMPSRTTRTRTCSCSSWKCFPALAREDSQLASHSRTACRSSHHYVGQIARSRRLRSIWAISSPAPGEPSRWQSFLQGERSARTNARQVWRSHSWCRVKPQCSSETRGSPALPGSVSQCQRDWCEVSPTPLLTNR
jgi:hypothetical protein